MEDVYRKLGVAVKLWQIEEAPNASSSIEVTEGWYNHEKGRVNVQHRTVEPSELEEWLEQTTKQSNSGTKTLVMRLVWVKVDPGKKQLNMSNSTREMLLGAFGLGLAYDYFQSYVTGITKLPREMTSHGPRDAFAFSYAPKLAAIWSATHLPPPFRCRTLTQGLVLIPSPTPDPKPEEYKPEILDPKEKEAKEEKPEKSVNQILRETLGSGWDAEVLCNPVFPAYLIALLLGIQIDLTQQSIKKKVQGLERRTGYHDFKTTREETATGLKQELSAKASGWATKLASVERKSKTVDQLLTMVSNEIGVQKEELGIDAENSNRHPPEVRNTALTKAMDLLRSNVAVLRYRHDMQVLDTQYIEKRVEIQIQAVSPLPLFHQLQTQTHALQLFHMIAQDDAFSNYKLSHHMSQTAEFSYRDAASMKTLAVVTMFFLPGSFVSALFSTDLFAWDDLNSSSSAIGVPTTPQMTLYWAVTIPLTVVTFVLYFLWLWYQKNERKRNFKSDEEMDKAAAGGEGEGMTSAWRRQTFISEANKYSNNV